MINPEEKRKDLVQKMFYLHELLERRNKATEADEQKVSPQYIGVRSYSGIHEQAK